MKGYPVNPYRDATLGELAAACAEIGIELDRIAPRTAAERKALVQRTRWVLLAIGRRIDSGESMPAEPEFILRRDARLPLAGTFLEWHAKRLDRGAADQRRETLSRAANFVLGNRAFRWLDPGEGALRDRPIFRVAQGDAALADCLRMLEAIR